jgi:Transposase DDE domain
LNNERVTVAEMVEHAAARTSRAVGGRHVLAIQDTTEINYQAKQGRKRNLGTVGNGSDVGLFVHPVLAVDADSGACLGVADVQVWRRSKSKAKDYRTQPIEDKESYRWIAGAEAAKARLTSARMVTIVADRESDIYEAWARVPDERTHVLARAAQDRGLTTRKLLFATLDGWPEIDRYEIDLPARPGKRSAHRATLAVRFGQVTLCRPATCKVGWAPATVTLSAIDVRELNPVIGEAPVHWRLLTTHAVTTAAEARQIIDWYRQRWNIEQLFRTSKRQGLDIENSLVENGDALEKLAVMAVIVAARTMQLVLARSPGAAEQPASRAFDGDEITVLGALQSKLPGRTAKQKNPYPPDTLAWAAWTIARLGGWTGYAKERPPGPITMRNGLHRFAAICQGFALASTLA